MEIDAKDYTVQLNIHMDHHNEFKEKVFDKESS